MDRGLIEKSFSQLRVHEMHLANGNQSARQRKLDAFADHFPFDVIIFIN